MTKRDFVQIAAALCQARPLTTKERAIPAAEAWRNCCYRMADALQKVNPRFDRERFLSACGVEA